MPVLPQASVENLPTLNSMELAILQTRLGKAAGEDEIPSEVYKTSPPVFARALMPIGLKASARMEVPFGLQGGLLMLLWAGKGAHTECGNSRAILLADAAAKIIKRPFREMLFESYGGVHSPLQLGGRRQQACDFACHVVHEHFAMAKLQKVQCGQVVCRFAFSVLHGTA